MKKSVLLLVVFFLFVSCGKEEVVEKEEKRDFIVETKNFAEFGKNTFLEKTGKIASSQDITVTSQATGRVSSLFVKEGDSVRKGQIITRLDDSILNYALNLERAKNTLEKSQISYDTTKLNLDKQISDIEINLENLKIDADNSKSSLELEKIENSLKKLAIDYDNLKISNEQTINGFYSSLEKEFSVFATLLDDVIDFSDTQLGVTIKNESENDGFEDYFGIRDTTQKKNTEALLRELITYKEDNQITTGVDFNTLSDLDIYNNKITQGYKKIETLLAALQVTFDNSVPSTGLTDTEIATKKTTIDGYQTTLNTYNSTFVVLKNSIASFLDTYLNNEASLVKQIELLESDKKIFTKGLDIQVQLQENTLTEAIASRDLTLQSMDAAITDARIAYKQSLKEYNKLTITSPISGVIGEVFIDLGQEVSNNLPIVTITNNKMNEATISFNKKELGFISEGTLAYIDFEGDTFTGSLYSLSKNADSNLKYPSRVRFNENIDLIGNIISVRVPITLKYPLIPLNVVKINSSGVGTINVFEDEKITQKDITLGDIYSDMVEVVDGLDENTQLIVNYVDNFDEEKFNLKVQ